MALSGRGPLFHEQFVYIHMPKTGGTFIRWALERELAPGTLHEGSSDRHSGWDSIPDEARNRPVLVYIRNPWDWYVSLYHWLMAVHGRFRLVENPNDPWPLLRVIFDDYTADFATMVRNACARALNQDDPRIDRGSPLLKLMTSQHDFYTALLRDTVGPGLSSGLLTVGHMESLVEDLVQFLGDAGVVLTVDAIQRIRSAPPRRVTEHWHYRQYYDDELRDLIEESCGIASRFGYSF